MQLPAFLGTHHGADAVGRLAGYVAAWEHDDPAVQPIAPDGRFELVPLLFASLGRTDRDRITAVVAALVDVEDLVTDYTGSTQAAHQLLAQGQRLVALIHLPGTATTPWSGSSTGVPERFQNSWSSPGGRRGRVLWADKPTAVGVPGCSLGPPTSAGPGTSRS